MTRFVVGDDRSQSTLFPCQFRTIVAIQFKRLLL
jgi:hypothetical protein